MGLEWWGSIEQDGQTEGTSQAVSILSVRALFPPRPSGQSKSYVPGGTLIRWDSVVLAGHAAATRYGAVVLCRLQGPCSPQESEEEDQEDKDELKDHPDGRKEQEQQEWGEEQGEKERCDEQDSRCACAKSHPFVLSSVPSLNSPNETRIA